MCYDLILFTCSRSRVNERPFFGKRKGVLDMGLFNWKKKEPIVEKPIQQQLIEYVDMSGNTKLADDYIKNTILTHFPIVQHEEAKAVMGVILIAEHDKDKAKEKYDELVRWWLKQVDALEDYSKPADIIPNIAFYCGLLEANNVVSEQEFDAWNQKYIDMANETEDRFLTRAREWYSKSNQQ